MTDPQATRDRREREPAPGPPDGWPVPTSAYLHVPFCRHRCGYCNFSVIAGRDDLADDFLTAINCELSWMDQHARMKTVFIGGGTPTHLTHRQLDLLFDSLDRWLPREAVAEMSVEANPEDITREKLELLMRRGVNRISLGIQSFDASKLQTLQRTHSRDSAIAAIELCAEIIGNVSIDLIFAAPDESLASWCDDLQTALALPITHLSTYSLTFEKGTSFWSERLRGTLHGLSEDDELAMYEAAIELASNQGLRHYEISSFARDGFRCQHNLAYWQGRGWLAAGPGAARFVNGRREVNHRSTTTYLKRVQTGLSPTDQCDVISKEQWACERAAFGIRMIDGVDLQPISEETGIDVATLRERELRNCVQQQLLEVRGTHHQLTKKGILMADSVATAFLG
jgi:oxygen-independent coproporphyrinogen III oxidase